MVYTLLNKAPDSKVGVVLRRLCLRGLGNGARRPGFCLRPPHRLQPSLGAAELDRQAGDHAARDLHR